MLENRVTFVEKCPTKNTIVHVRQKTEEIEENSILPGKYIKLENDPDADETYFETGA